MRCSLVCHGVPQEAGLHEERCRRWGLASLCRPPQPGSRPGVQEERNKTDEKVMEATLANDPAKLKTLLAQKKHTALGRPDDEGRVAFVGVKKIMMH